jgi:phosphoglycolate phosphatase-like HAD superfamily hydrolase
MQLVMFDIDGTLVDSAGVDGDSFARAVRAELGVDVDETWNSYRHVTDSGILAQILSENAAARDQPGARARMKRRFVSLIEDHIGNGAGFTAIPGARELVDELQSSPLVVVAFATGGWRESAELKLTAAGIRYAGFAFATSSEAESRVEIMRIAERRASAGHEFSRRTYFGDTPWDRRACSELGYDFVAVGDRVSHAYRYADLRDKKRILAGLGL